MPEFKDFAISELELDRENPRLPTGLMKAGEEEILGYLARETNIEELITSIGENGFFPGEAIVVTENKAKDGIYTVLEGNRRLTALKLLQAPELAESISRISRGVLDAVEKAQNRPDHVPAYEVDRREDVLQYLGFRHISGVQRWGPLAKARYLKILYRQAEGDPDTRYRQIAGEIGSRRDAVRKSLDALAAYEVVDRQEFFNIPKLNEASFQFGVFYTALGNSKVAIFTGIRENDGQPTHPIEDPSKLNTDTIQELVEWMSVKDAAGRTRLGDSRNIKYLTEVVATPRALDLFRRGAALEVAYRETPDLQNEFIRELQNATSSVKSASEKLSAVDNANPEVKGVLSDLYRELHRVAKSLGLEEVARQEKADAGD